MPSNVPVQSPDFVRYASPMAVPFHTPELIVPTDERFERVVIFGSDVVAARRVSKRSVE
jgi:hypothetical protein